MYTASKGSSGVAPVVTTIIWSEVSLIILLHNKMNQELYKSTSVAKVAIIYQKTKLIVLRTPVTGATSINYLKKYPLHFVVCYVTKKYKSRTIWKALL